MLIDSYLIQQRANVFRRGYRNWRQFATKRQQHNAVPVTEIKGAEGEVMDIATGVITVPAQPVEPLGNRNLDMKLPLARSRDSLSAGFGSREALSSPASPALLPSAISINRLSRTNLDRQSAHNLSLHALQDALQAHPGAKTLSTAELDEALHPEHWTKFYITPYTEAPKKKILPVSTAMLELHMEQACKAKMPTYKRSADYWMVHLGVGGFHRSHQAVYTDLLLHYYENQKDAEPDEVFGICGMGLMPWDSKMYQTMLDQDNLYTVLSRSDAGTDAHVVGAIMEYIFAPDDHDVAIEKLAAPETRIVSLTVTEKGYCQNVAGVLDMSNPMVMHDLQDLDHPQTALGMITAGMLRRKERGMDSLTVLSCDNMPENGDTFKKILLEFVHHVDPALEEWMKEHTSFPNTMVDRITPVTEEQHRIILKDEFGIDDQWPVVAEHYGQWVVEDHFVGGRPDWEKVGVLFVPDVKPYEYMKLRLLNGGHSALAYLSYLAGHLFVDLAMGDAAVGGFVVTYLQSLKPCIPEVPGVNLDEYSDMLVKRFSNPYIKDKVERLAEDGSKKLYNTMRGPILELTHLHKSTQCIATAVAGFIKFMSGTDVHGTPIPCIRDPQAAVLQQPCLNSCLSFDATEPLLIVFGKEVVALSNFVQEVSIALQSIVVDGAVRAMLQAAASCT